MLQEETAHMPGTACIAAPDRQDPIRRKQIVDRI